MHLIQPYGGIHYLCCLRVCTNPAWSVLGFLFIEGKHIALSVKPQAHMAQRTSPAGDLYLSPPTHFHISHFHLFTSTPSFSLLLLSSFQAFVIFFYFISFSPRIYVSQMTSYIILRLTEWNVFTGASFFNRLKCTVFCIITHQLRLLKSFKKTGLLGSFTSKCSGKCATEP